MDKEVQGIFSSKKGFTKVIATLEKDSYYSQDNIPLSCFIDNTQSEIDVSKIKIKVNKETVMEPSKYILEG